MNNLSDVARRRLLSTLGEISAGLVAGSSLTALAVAETRKAKSTSAEAGESEDVGPTEDLMREHGVLNRVLLIYDHFGHRIEQKEDLDGAWVVAAAQIIRSFVEDYHERQEEQFLFPRFEKAGKLTDLVGVLKTQHRAGRRLTERILQLAHAREPESRNDLAQALRQFVRMYRPHEAREDTVLFPELHKIVSRHEFDALGEQFEKNEHKQFGTDGFDLYRDKVAGLEKQLGIYELAQFTPGPVDRRS